MPQTISELNYTKDWRNAEDFPTYEGSEAQVRADLQQLPNEIRTYLNTVIVGIINQMLADISQLVAGTVTDNSVYTAALQQASVTLAKMAANSVGTLQLVDACVTAAKYAPGSIPTSALAAQSVDMNALADNAVRSRHVANSQITNDKLGTDILPASVGFVVGTAEPTEASFSPGQVYLKLESA